MLSTKTPSLPVKPLSADREDVSQKKQSREQERRVWNSGRDDRALSRIIPWFSMDHKLAAAESMGWVEFLQAQAGLVRLSRA